MGERQTACTVKAGFSMADIRQKRHINSMETKQTVYLLGKMAPYSIEKACETAVEDIEKLFNRRIKNGTT